MGKNANGSDLVLALQLAAAEELGGLHTIQGNRLKRADLAMSELPGGKEALKAQLRAQWETTQYVLQKSGKESVDVYRTILLKRADVAGATKLRQFSKEYARELTSLPRLRLMRSGASSWTSNRQAANWWGGAGVLKYDPKTDARIVLRLRVPRTAVLLIPVFGHGWAEENEVVIVGTAWQKWDAWKDAAPSFDDIADGSKLASLQRGLRKSRKKTRADDSGDLFSAPVTSQEPEVDLTEEDEKQGAHWLSSRPSQAAKLAGDMARIREKRANKPPYTDVNLAPLLRHLVDPDAEAARLASLVHAAGAAQRGEPLDDAQMRRAVAYYRASDLRQGRESPNREWPERLRSAYRPKPSSK